MFGILIFSQNREHEKKKRQTRENKYIWKNE